MERFRGRIALGGILLALIGAPVPAGAHGFHGAALMESSASAWDSKVRNGLGLPSSYQAGSGDLKDLLTRAAPGSAGRVVSTPAVDREKVKATVQELVSYLKYMDRENILAEEFPNFPMDQIPEFRRRVVYILGDIGPAALPDVLAGMSDAEAQAHPGPGGAVSKFQDPYFDPTLVISKNCRGDLDKVVKINEDSAALSSDVFKAAMEVLPPLMRDKDSTIKTTAQGMMRRIEKQVTISVLLAIAADTNSPASGTVLTLLEQRLAEGCKLTPEDALRASDVLRSNPSPALKKLARAVVERCYAERATGTLVNDLCIADNTLKPAIAQVLVRRFKAKEALSSDQAAALLSLLGSADAGISPCFEDVLNEGLRESHLEVMKKAAADSNETVRSFAAAWIISHFPKAMEPDALLQALANPDSKLGIAVYRSLSRRQLLPAEAEAIRSHPDMLFKALHAQTPSSRAAAAKFAGALRVREAVPDLIALLTDPDPDVFQAADLALPAITNQFLGPDLFAGEGAKEAAQRKWREWWRGQGGK